MYHALAPVDEALVVQIDECIDDPIVVLLVHGETRTRPVAARAELLQLLEDDATVFMRPVPRMFQKLIAGQIRFLDALLAQATNHLRLGSDGGMVGPWHPASVFTQHPSTAHQHVLNGVIEHVPHMQNARHIRGRNHHRIGLTVIGLALEKFVFQPVTVPLFFTGTWIVGSRDFHVLRAVYLRAKIG